MSCVPAVKGTVHEKMIFVGVDGQRHGLEGVQQGLLHATTVNPVCLIHFWALAIHKRDEYAKVEVPMLPVTHGLEFTGLQVLLYTVLLVISTMLPYVVGMSGFIYLVGVTVLNIRFLYWAWRLFRGAYQEAAMKTFWYSIIYLMVLFVLLLVDHYFPI
jgi:protoheme IX farnesyltransferase